MASSILLHGVRCKTLFDTSASHSFINGVFSSTHRVAIVETRDLKKVQVPDHVFYITKFFPVFLV